ncbi:hypothetical protein HAALTHF_19510n [Vreelandella aquamarina]|nr:hypothetical protein HAALTHF_19510n [Halomonas axialensis]
MNFTCTALWTKRTWRLPTEKCRWARWWWIPRGEIIGAGHNAPLASCDPSGHAEVRALREAGQRLGNYRLEGCTLFVTLEPCMMCAGTMVHARIARLVYGAPEPRTGMVESKANLLAQPWFNHQIEITGGVLAVPAKRLLKQFFAEKR